MGAKRTLLGRDRLSRRQGLTLFKPNLGEWPNHRRQPDARRSPPVQQRLDDVGRQQGQAEQAAQIAPLDLLRGCHLADGRGPALIYHALVSERPRQRLYLCRISARDDRRHAFRHRRYDNLPAGPAPDGQRHPDRDAGRRARAATFSASGAIAVRTRTSPASPSSRNRMSAPSGPTTTRSTSDRTILARSAGNNCSHSGSSRC
jgi:hypothetical protein